MTRKVQIRRVARARAMIPPASPMAQQTRTGTTRCGLQAIGLKGVWAQYRAAERGTKVPPGKDDTLVLSPPAARRSSAPGRIAGPVEGDSLLPRRAYFIVSRLYNEP